jgi:hypothetical protein
MQNTHKAGVAWAQRPSRWESLRPWLLRYSIILNAFAVPAAIMFMRRPSGRPTRERN